MEEVNTKRSRSLSIILSNVTRKSEWRKLSLLEMLDFKVNSIVSWITKFIHKTIADILQGWKLNRNLSDLYFPIYWKNWAAEEYRLIPTQLETINRSK